MFDFLKRPKKREPAFIALDIGTVSVKALLFTVEQKTNKKGERIGERAVIRGAGKVSHNLSDLHNAAITDIAGVAGGIKKAIREATKETGLAAEKMVVGVGGEFIRGVTSVLDHEREDKEAKIDDAELQNIIHKLEWKAFGEVRRGISDETGCPEIDIRLMQSSIVEAAIDGYKVSNPLGFQGKNIRLSIFNAFSSLMHYDALNAIVNEISMECLGIVSEPHALSRCLNEYSGEKSALLIDVGGMDTDVSLIEKGVLRGTRLFGIGSHAITKRIATELNISMDEAEQIKQAYAGDKLEKKSKKWVETLIENDIDVWLSGLVLALEELTETKGLPSKILLCGGGIHLPEIRDTLTQKKWHQKLPFHEKPEITPISSSHLTNNLIDETRGLKNSEDIVPLALVSSGLELLEEENRMQKILKKVIGIMKV